METKPCPWCEKEQGVTTSPGVSHGICQIHVEQLRAELRTIRPAKTSSHISTTKNAMGELPCEQRETGTGTRKNGGANHAREAQAEAAESLSAAGGVLTRNDAKEAGPERRQAPARYFENQYGRITCA